MDDIERLLYRREGFILPRPGVASQGAPAFLGKITSTGGNLAATKFMLVNPVEVTGAETEGGSPSYATDTSVSIPVYLVGGTPATGDYILCRRVDHRWVADKRTGAPAPGGPVNFSGCTCQGTPLVLNLTIQYLFGTTAATYNHAFRDATLTWYGPGESAPYGSPYGSACYVSDESWFDDSGFECYYALICTGSQYQIGHSATSPSSGGYPTLDIVGAQRTFNIGASNPTLGTNTCSPFNLVFGVQAPSTPSILYHISG